MFFSLKLKLENAKFRHKSENKSIFKSKTTNGNVYISNFNVFSYDNYSVLVLKVFEFDVAVIVESLEMFGNRVKAAHYASF